MKKKIKNEDLEITLLLDAIYMKHGYDFRSYARESIKRRILQRLSISGLKNISEMLHKLIYDINFFEELLLDFSINVTEMFRDPLFYKAFRKKIIPILKTYSFLKIWHAGCSTGEEVYSMAILLKEEGLYHKAKIYATDFNQVVLQKAKQGIFPISQIKKYTTNYQKAGGMESFADYYTAKYNLAVIDKSLKENIIFADHNLASDGVFSEMNLILCRNVLIYFANDLQNRVIKLFRDSLYPNGFLCLGSKESLNFSKYVDNFDRVLAKEKIYRKKR